MSSIAMHISKFILLAACGTAALAQQYTITTVAGGAPPATPATAASTSIGQPTRVATDAAGNVYFSSLHSVFKISTAGVMTRVAGTSRPGFSGDGGPALNAQLNAPFGIAVDAAGTIYIADSNNNRVRAVSPDGIIRTFAGNGIVSPGGPRTYNDGGPATDGNLHLPQGVAVDKSGNVYIADTGDNIVRKVDTNGIITTIAGDSFPGFMGDGGTAVDAELHSPSDVAVDASGNVLIADSANAHIRKVTPDGKIDSIAGKNAIGYSGDDGPATAAGLIAPVALAIDGSGNIFIAENGDSRVRRIDSKGVIVTVAGTDSIGFAPENTSANHTPLNSPTGVAADSSGNIYIADSLNLRIRKVTSSGTISTYAGNGVYSFSGDGGPATAAQLYGPQGVAVDSAGNLYVADTANNVVRRVTKDGVISRVAGTGTAGSGGDGSAATSAQLNGPQGLAVDGNGNLYIADTLNARVRRVTAAGTISTVAGNGNFGFGGDGAAATAAQLNLPTAVAVDAAGNLYIADFSNNRIRMVSTGGTITTVAGNGNAGYSGDGGPATAARLNTPQGVAVDAGGNIYIADTQNNAVRLVTPNGIIRTIAGNGSPGSGGDGSTAVRAQVGNPRAVAADTIGNVYVADGTGRVRKIFPTGLITTIAGTGVAGYSGDGGPAASAQLSGPTALALDSASNIYIADTGNHAVRVLQFAASGISVSAVVHGATGQASSIAPGEVVVIYGSGLGPASLTQFQLSSTGLVPTTVAGTRVFFNGVAGPILYTSANQVAAIAPFELSGTRAEVYVQYQGQTSTPVNVAVAPASPGIFTANGSGSGQALVINQDTSVNGQSRPAPAGSIVTFYITGAGQTNPTGENGKPGAVPLPLPVLPVTVTIGGRTAELRYAGAAQGLVAGVIQVNAVVPSGGGTGAVPLVVQVGSASSPAGVTIWVQ